MFIYPVTLSPCNESYRNQVSRCAHVPLNDRYLSLQSTATVSPSLERLTLIILPFSILSGALRSVRFECSTFYFKNV